MTVGITISLSAFFALLLCSKCSFLYPFNDWYDANVIFTVGKGLMNGIVPYVDLPDHKGPYCFLLYGIAYLISHKSFLGLFILELFSFGSFLYIIHMIIKIYSEDDFLPVYPIIAFVIASSATFVQGGSLEEFSLPLIAFALYVSLKVIRNRELPLYIIFLSGIFSGILFWSKFTLCGAYLAFVIVYGIVCIREKKWKSLWKGAGIFLIGYIVAFIPWLLYFLMNHALDTFLDTYLFSNIFGYTNEAGMSIFARIWAIVSVAFRFYFRRGNIALTFFQILGLAGMLSLPKDTMTWKEKAACMLIAVFTNVGIFFSGRAHGYYGLVTGVFLVFGAFSASFWIARLYQKETYQKSFYKVVPVFVSFVIGAILAFRISDNTYMIKYKKINLPQYQFLNTISKYEDQSILNYAFLDCGMYTVLGTIPDFKGYCVTNLYYDEGVMLQKGYLSEEKTNFVITWTENPMKWEELPGKFPEVAEKYRLIDMSDYFCEGGYRTFGLWIRKSTELK